MPVDAAPSVLDAFLTRGDLADLALFLWASTSSLAAAVLGRELFAATRRFDAFVRELHRFNDRFGVRDDDRR
jgi:hypothetical protein